ncbi:ATP-dependent 6-phosphofructokinase [Mycoplasmoides pirum]|uniref:ATP-dependent 6-phosphofructokinase n=1 Tax=Mycoplasmoides pirum TaxID=2122 RepID=UPI00055F4E49|nr:ATP-dependent 6-phosphofructokinase [Mycoplasmoides pirum]
MIKNKVIKKIAILTSGGDCPGMNTAIYSLVEQSLYFGYKPYLVYEGYKGLVEDNIKLANLSETKKNSILGGTFIYSARLPEFKELNVRQKAANNLIKRGIDTLFVIGGDGSYQGARLLSKLKINCIGLPGTIDNDISSTDFTIGFYTALDSIDQALIKNNHTAISHDRVTILEAMGRYCADLSFYSGIANNADLIITHENPMSAETIAKKVKEAYKKDKNRRTYLIVVSERLYGTNKYQSLEEIGQTILKETNKIVNINRLGYLQRGGNPNAMDRILAMQLGHYAVNLIHKNKKNRVVGIKDNKIVDYDFDYALSMKNQNRKKEILQFNLIKEEV